jgi:pimeloyl-ACP methyl ester carboxylesterase
MAGMPVPLVLLPGMNCGPSLWDDPVAGLRAEVDTARRQVVVERLDRPSLDGQVEALLDRLPERFALGGLSLGAIVAMALHRLAPERVAGLFLLATNSRAPTPSQHAAWQAQLDRLTSGHTPRELQEDLLTVLVGVHAEPALAERALQLSDDVGSDELAAQLRLQQTRIDERPGLRQVTVPCTVVAAAEDQLCPLDRHTEIHSLVKGSELVVIRGAPHLATLSHGPSVAAAMTDWLRRVDA